MITTSSNTVRFGSCSLAGTDPDRPQKINQDRCFGFELHDNDTIYVMGVMDGHGRQGHDVTEYLVHELPAQLKKHLPKNNVKKNDAGQQSTNDEKELQRLVQQQKIDYVELGGADPQEWSAQQDPIRQALVDAFLSAHLQARRNPKIPTGRSGTTAVVCVIVREENADNDCHTIYTASVGDSSAFLISSQQQRVVERLDTPSTITANAKERERIQQRPGRIDDNGNVFYGPVGIAMTRALGDAVMLPAGVLPVPLISCRRNISATAEAPCFVCCCTDGISDVLSREELASTIIEKATTSALSTVAKQVCDQAQKAWLADLPIETKGDDCTLTLAALPFLP